MKTPPPPDFDAFFERFKSNLPPGIQAFSAEMERTVKDGMQMALERMDLVTRNDFDVQAGVLAKTRAKLDALEQRVAELERRLDAAPTANAHLATDNPRD